MTQTAKSPKPDSLLGWLGIADAPNWRVAHPLGICLGVLLLVLFALALIAAFAVIGSVFSPAVITQSGGTNLGIGALIVALLGAPFLIWRAIVAQTTVDLQKEGLMTDRISKAVEQLGAEKKVDKIGRPVTIWTGDSTTVTRLVKNRSDFIVPAKSKITKDVWGQTYSEENDEVFEGPHLDITTWPKERTEIEWRNQTIQTFESEAIGGFGDWQVFSETVPNIEVRIGGLLSLERIAQDSVKYDKGRDHVRVMEILCAYVRENASALNLEPTPNLKRRKDVRLDVQTAIFVIGRRSEPQLGIERAQKYRLDLRTTNLDGCDFAAGDFSAAMFANSRFEAADFTDCQLHGTRFIGSLLNYCYFTRAELTGTNFSHTTINQPSEGKGGWAHTINLGKINGIALFGADISAIDFLSHPKGLLKTIGNRDTILSAEMDYARNGYFKDADSARLQHQNAALDHQTLEKLPSLTGFERWVSFGNGDMATGYMHTNFLEGLGLTGWPYQ